MYTKVTPGLRFWNCALIVLEGNMDASSARRSQLCLKWASHMTAPLFAAVKSRLFACTTPGTHKEPA